MKILLSANERAVPGLQGLDGSEGGRVDEDGKREEPDLPDISPLHHAGALFKIL